MEDFADAFQPLRDALLAKTKKVRAHQELMESEPYREQQTRLHRLMRGAIEGLQANWLMSTRSPLLADHTLTFRFVDDAIFSVVGIASAIQNGAHAPAKREMRYALETACKHYYVDCNDMLCGAELNQRLDKLENDLPRSSVNFIKDSGFFSLDPGESKELTDEISSLYSYLSKFVHRSREQIDLYLAAIERGSSPGFETVPEFRAANREYERLCDIILFLSFCILAQSGLAGEVLVNVFDRNPRWPYYKTKYMSRLSKYHDYKMERKSK